MELIINTTEDSHFSLFLLEKAKITAALTVDDNGRLSENLLKKIKEFLSANHTKLGELAKIGVVSGPGNFSRIRTGIATANALAFGLKIAAVGIKSTNPSDLQKVYTSTERLAAPSYGRKPNITKAKPKKFKLKP
ncbi:MAG: hypothetical protein ACM3KM_03855 [Acidobacteriaceae bacterium]